MEYVKEEEAFTLNQYEYCGNNPVSMTDTDGHVLIIFEGGDKMKNGATSPYSPFTRAAKADKAQIDSEKSKLTRAAEDKARLAMVANSHGLKELAQNRQAQSRALKAQIMEAQVVQTYDEASFIREWNAIPDNQPCQVVFRMHGSTGGKLMPEAFLNSSFRTAGYPVSNFAAMQVKPSVDTLIMFSCYSARPSQTNSLMETFSLLAPNAQIVAPDEGVCTDAGTMQDVVTKHSGRYLRVNTSANQPGQPVERSIIGRSLGGTIREKLHTANSAIPIPTI